MTRKEYKKIKNLLYKYLTEDFKDENILNVAIFDPDSGKPMYGNVNLNSVMNKVTAALLTCVDDKRRLNG